jgi:hypothetical protein
MKNVKVEVNGTICTITIDLGKEFGPSSSGKNIIIASTEGNQSIAGGAKLGLNLYRANEGAPKVIKTSSAKAASPVTEYPAVKGQPKTDDVAEFVKASKAAAGMAPDQEF